jgi:HlyD family secretion protein
MRLSQIPWTKIALGLAATLLLFVVVRTVRAGAATAPIPKDAKHADRVLAGSGSAGSRVGGNGIVEPSGRESKLASNTQGVVQSIVVKEGDYVAEGAVLIELESSQQRAAALAADADVALANAELTRTLHGLRAEDVDAAIAESEAAKSRADLANTSLGRTEALAKTGALSADELDRARQQTKDADALSRASDARRRAALSGSRPEDVLVARTRLAAAKARRDEARARLEQMTLRAPHAGEVLQIKVRAGEYYTPSAGPLAILGDTKKLQVRIDVDERDIASVVVGAHATVQADAFRSRTFGGKVIEVGRRMGRKNVRSDDPTERIDTKVLEVVVALDETSEPKALVPGLRVMSYIDVTPHP